MMTIRQSRIQEKAKHSAQKNIPGFIKKSQKFKKPLHPAVCYVIVFYRLKDRYIQRFSDDVLLVMQARSDENE